MNSNLTIKQVGFSLIELLIGVGITAILVAVAMPGLNSWINNTKTRTATESIQSGLLKARAEAVARNTNVAFTMGVNSDWTISVVNPDTLIESRSASDGSTGVAVAILPGGANTITFSGLGTVGIPTSQPNNIDGTAPIAQFDLNNPNGTKTYRITIGVGGNSKMCEPGGYGLAAC